MFVTLKVGDIDRIKANQRRPQADIRFRQTIARQIAVLAEDLLQTLKRFKDFSNRFVVGFLAGGKTGLVNAVINVVVNPAVQLIDFVSQLNRIVIPGARAMGVEGGVEHADDLRRFIADNRLVFLVPQNRYGDAPGVVRVGAQIKLVEEIVMIQFITRRSREIMVERPAVFQH